MCFRHRFPKPKVGGSSPPGRIAQVSEGKAITQADKPSSESQNQKLASSLFSDLENDPDLRLIVERWSELSVELRQAIGRMVR